MTSISQPNTLLQKTINQTKLALSTGALQPIATEYQVIEDQGISFVVRILVNLIRKEKAKQEKPQDFNPFLPYEKDLFVSDISDTHLCLLNKYNVVENHLLIVTRDFEAQENYLTLADFTALACGLKEIDGLGFYNGGKLAGASQKHKHLQLVPFPLVPNQKTLPVEIVLQQANFNQGIGVTPLFNFPHGIILLNHFKNPEILFKTYEHLLNHLGIEKKGIICPHAYNLLVTRNWMMMVKRCQETYQDIPVNSLGFSGALLVKNQTQLELLKQITPLQLLKEVSSSI
ncbi:MAG: phosphorylase [Microcystaceae cyanobacterium]